MAVMHAPRPWWYHLALRLCPSRCREIPEANNPDRIVLRQVMLWPKTAYVQQFASGEDPDWLHTHPWKRLWVFVLWGSYSETRTNRTRRVRAPAVYSMDETVVHQVADPRSHTSIIVGLGRVEEIRKYFPADAVLRGVPWEEHVKKQVVRL